MCLPRNEFRPCFISFSLSCKDRHRGTVPILLLRDPGVTNGLGNLHLVGYTRVIMGCLGAIICHLSSRSLKP